MTSIVFMILLGATSFSLVFRGLEGDKILVDMITASNLTPEMFLISILIVGSINYIILVYIFNTPIIYNSLFLGLFATFLIYPILAKILSWIDNIVQVSIDDKKKQ